MSSKCSDIKNSFITKINSGKYKLELIHCVVCSHKAYQTLADKERREIPIKTVICKNCGLVQTNPRLTEESNNFFYSEDYKSSQNQGTNQDLVFFNIQRKRGKKIYDYLRNNLNIELKDKFITEVGTGAGGIISYLKDKGNEVYGLDISPDYIKIAKKKKINVELGDCTKLLRIKRKPDVIIYNHVLEHLLNPIKELKKIKKFMKKDTILYIEVPGIKNIPNSHEMSFHKYLTITHNYYFTKTTFMNMIKKVGGFKILNINEKVQAILIIDEKRKGQTTRGGRNKNKIINDYGDSIAFLRKLRQGKRNIFSKKMLKVNIKILIKKIPFYKYLRDVYFLFKTIR